MLIKAKFQLFQQFTFLYHTHKFLNNLYLSTKNVSFEIRTYSACPFHGWTSVYENNMAAKSANQSKLRKSETTLHCTQGGLQG